MNKSTSIKELASALSKAQSEFPVVKFDSQNPFLKNKYATLGAVIETARPVLAKYELSIMQSPVSEGDKIGVTTLLLHSSGEYIEDTIYLPTTESKGLSVAQSAGVVISYLRRYSLQSFLNMYADEDNDGHQEKKEEVKPVKQELSEGERKQTVMVLWEKLIKRAAAQSVPFEPLAASMTSEEMKAAYEELKKRVLIAEAK
jgi:hypothetical protein